MSRKLADAVAALAEAVAALADRVSKLFSSFVELNRLTVEFTWAIVDLRVSAVPTSCLLVWLKLTRVASRVDLFLCTRLFTLVRSWLSC